MGGFYRHENVTSFLWGSVASVAGIMLLFCFSVFFVVAVAPTGELPTSQGSGSVPALEYCGGNCTFSERAGVSSNDRGVASTGEVQSGTKTSRTVQGHEKVLRDAPSTIAMDRTGGPDFQIDASVVDGNGPKLQLEFCGGNCTFSESAGVSSDDSDMALTSETQSGIKTSPTGQAHVKVARDAPSTILMDSTEVAKVHGKASHVEGIEASLLQDVKRSRKASTRRRRHPSRYRKLRSNAAAVMGVMVLGLILWKLGRKWRRRGRGKSADELMAEAQSLYSLEYRGGREVFEPGEPSIPPSLQYESLSSVILPSPYTDGSTYVAEAERRTDAWATSTVSGGESSPSDMPHPLRDEPYQ